MGNIWLEHFAKMNNNNGDRKKERFEKMLSEVNAWMSELGEEKSSATQRQEVLALMGMSIQLQTSIAIMNRLDEIELKLS